ncbi:MAG: hypothetical protein IT306_22055 [Chloroflexi bacterium]|nr:hypothetical protein [Chloroflexota bacterium]
MARAKRAGDAEHPRKASSENRVSAAFLRALADLDFVRNCTVEYTDAGLAIWTIIDAPLDDRAARQQVYDAELAAADEAPEARVTFRLLNVREHSAETLHQLVPSLPDEWLTGEGSA